MSLFRLVEWVTHTIPNASAIYNASFFQEREQLIVGGEDGQIVILDPGYREKKNHVLGTCQTKYPVLQMLCGDFLPELKNVLAVLSPQKLTFYKVIHENPDDVHASFNEIISHSFPISAWNMCVVTPENSSESPQILVQSIDCKLSLYQGDQCVFSMVPTRALHPGPIGFCNTTQALVAANNGILASTKFSLMSSGSQKRVRFEWEFNLGDTAIQMELTEGNNPTIIVLCRRHVSAFKENGDVVWQIRLEAVGMSMCLYRSLLINNTQFNRLIVATADDTLLIFQDNKLVWNCNAQMSPIGLLVCSYNKMYENTITLMGPDGKIVVGYLGTEPSLYKVPVDKFIVNYAERIEQFKELELKIRESDVAGGAVRRREGIQMKLTVGEIGKRTVEPNAANNAPYCNVVVDLSELHSVSKLHINILSECASPTKQIVLHVSSAQSTANIQIPFYVGAKKPPTSNRVTIAAHCFSSQMTVIKTIDLPFKVLFEETQIDRNARFKVTLDTAGAVIPVNKLFSEYEADNPQSIGFTLFGTDKTVSVFAANKSNRYRVQSEHLCLLQIVSKELVKRIREVAGEIEIGGVIPFEYMRETLDTIQELESEKKSNAKTMECRTKEVRAIEALSLNSCKTGNMANIPAMDALFDKAYRELLDVMDAYNSVSAKIETEKTTLNSLFQLAEDLSKLSKIDTILNGDFWTNTQQSLRDRLRWSVRSERGNEMSMIEKLCEHSTKELPKIKEEEEEEEEAVAE